MTGCRLVVTALVDFGEELAEGDGLECRVARDPFEERRQERRGRGLPRALWFEDDAAGVRLVRVLEMDELEGGQELVGGQDGISRVGPEERGELAVGGRRGDVGPATEGEREGLGEGEGIRGARPGGRQVGVGQDHAVGTRGLQPRPEVGRAGIGEGRGRVHPGARGRMEARLAQEGVPPCELFGDFVQQSAARQGGDVDGDVGLVDELVAIGGRGQALQLLSGPPARLAVGQEALHRDGVGRQRQGDAAIGEEHIRHLLLQLEGGFRRWCEVRARTSPRAG